MEVILIVADDRSLCESLRTALGDTSLSLCESTAEDALRRLISMKADAVIVDDTPNLGLPAVKRIRESYPYLPILMLTSRSDTETLASIALAGATGYLVKPFGCDALRRILEGMIPLPVRPVSPQRENGGDISRRTPNLIQYQTALRWLGRISSYIADTRRLSESLIDALIDVFNVTRCAILLEEDGRGVGITASHGIPDAVKESARFRFNYGLMRWFESNACIFDSAAASDPDARKQMAILGAKIGVPLVRGGRVCGALLLGEKASGGEYVPEETELLSMIARTASIAIDNAHRYHQLVVEQQQLDVILSNVSSGVVVVGADKNVRLLNGSAERLLQVRAEDVLGRSVQKLGSAFADVVLRTMADGKPRIRQEIHDPAIHATLGLSTTPLGQHGVAVLFSRLPEERASAEEIAYSPFWEYLASRVAQEIKNPLVAVNTFAQLLPKKYDSPDFREAFSDVVQKEVNRINSVVETLFDFARHPRLILKRVDLNETVQNVLRSFEDELRERQIKLETTWDPNRPEANIDVEYMSQALHNVLQNSIEAMPSGGVLRVNTRKDEHGCEIVIADSGPGIAEQDAPHIFMPFFSTKEQGMGLGLTVAHRIARQHDGDLRLVPGREGEGGVFQFRLPLAEKQDADRPSH